MQNDVVKCIVCSTSMVQRSRRLMKYCSNRCRNIAVMNSPKTIQWKKDHAEEIKRKGRDYHKRSRMRALNKAGGGNVRCSNCGCDDIRILGINHKNGGGYAEYGNGTNIYAKINNNQRPIDNLNILCKVCNIVHFVELKYGSRFEIKHISSDI